MADIIRGKILPDGRIKSTVEGSISMVNHQSAANFLKTMETLAGGELHIERNTAKPHHSHAHLGPDATVQHEH